jgi:hypothetical protein
MRALEAAPMLTSSRNTPKLFYATDTAKWTMSALVAQPMQVLQLGTNKA